VNKRALIAAVLTAVLTLSCGVGEPEGEPRYVILFISDGWSYEHLEAARSYTGEEPVYADWLTYAMSTWDTDTRRANGGVGYDPERAWADFGYTIRAATDSAAAATAMYTGFKADSGNICTGPADLVRLAGVRDYAEVMGLASGAVTSVYVSHATPGAWYAHNDDRTNGYALFDEGVWGRPGSTGSGEGYGGGRGGSCGLPEVLIGGGHPGWNADYVLASQRDALAADCANHGGWRLVERLAGSPDGGERLLAAARNPRTERLFGLFGGEDGCLDYALADFSGVNPENPTLAECTEAALCVLSRNPRGFVLLVEGGAVDWASHAGDMDRMLGEQRDFDAAVRITSDWVEDDANPSSWGNTLVVVTGDHECGCLTAGPGIFKGEPLGEVSGRTLALERPYDPTGLRASWEDVDADGVVDPDEEVYWAWNSHGHTNALVPLYVKGEWTRLFQGYVVAEDPVRGPYIDNTSLFLVLFGALMEE
jgi:alkaline phosphatase